MAFPEFFADHLTPLESCGFQRGTVDLHDSAIRRQNSDKSRQVVEDRSKEGLALAERFLEAPACGDILHKDEEAVDLALRVCVRHVMGVDPARVLARIMRLNFKANILTL
ncbi:hypothetical protein SDC9_190197 [bioreactor metagenome]|uniref:Uncharacterized protein n=1 Tax=bioreactor metagenome TaxID=1076179 RepID=A0A645HUW0_9ZZZZ